MKIKLPQIDTDDDWRCLCGNTTEADGFFACNWAGQQMEPKGDWPGLYVCFRCKRVVDGETSEVLNEYSGKRPQTEKEQKVYRAHVEALEAEGLDTSDAQSAVDVAAIVRSTKQTEARK